MSFSGFSASRKSIWAMTTEAWWSSIDSPRKITLSLSRREKMSYARSPRLVCSTTMGISMSVAPCPSLVLFFTGGATRTAWPCPVPVVHPSWPTLFYETPQHLVQRPLAPENRAHSFQPTALGEVAPQLREGDANPARLVLDLVVNLGVRDLYPKPVGKRVQEYLTAQAVLDPPAHVLLELLPVHLGAFRVDSAAGQSLGELDELPARFFPHRLLRKGPHLSPPPTG